MYKNILCPIDGSSTSNDGMHEAILLAKDQNAKLRFLHIVDTYFPALDTTGDLNVVYIADMLISNGKKIIKKAEAAAHKAGVVFDSKIIETIGGQVAKFIVEDADEWSADLIVMGTHGLRGIERLVMGSDAETVVRTSPVPVLLVRSAPKSNKKS